MEGDAKYPQGWGAIWNHTGMEDMHNTGGRRQVTMRTELMGDAGGYWVKQLWAGLERKRCVNCLCQDATTFTNWLACFRTCRWIWWAFWADFWRNSHMPPTKVNGKNTRYWVKHLRDWVENPNVTKRCVYCLFQDATVFSNCLSSSIVEKNTPMLQKNWNCTKCSVSEPTFSKVAPQKNWDHAFFHQAVLVYFEQIHSEYLKGSYIVCYFIWSTGHWDRHLFYLVQCKRAVAGYLAFMSPRPSDWPALTIGFSTNNKEARASSIFRFSKVWTQIGCLPN